MLGTAACLGMRRTVDYLIASQPYGVTLCDLKDQASHPTQDTAPQPQSSLPHPTPVPPRPRVTPPSDPLLLQGAYRRGLRMATDDERLVSISASLQGNTVLHCVVAHGDTAMIRHLVRHGAGHLRMKNDSGFSVLTWAALVGSPEMVQEVLRLSATPLWSWGPVTANRCAEQRRTRLRGRLPTVGASPVLPDLKAHPAPCAPSNPIPPRTCTCTHMHMHAHAHAHARTCTHMHAHARIRTRTRTHTHAHTHARPCTPHPIRTERCHLPPFGPPSRPTPVGSPRPRYDVDALLDMLAIVAEMGREQLIRLPHFRQLISDMWRTFARRTLWMLATFHLLNLLFICIIMLRRAIHPAAAIGHLIWLSVPGTLWFLYMDVRSALLVGRGGASSQQLHLVFSAVSTAVYAAGVSLALLFYYLYPLHSRDAGALGVASAFGWLRLFNYLRMWSFLGELVFTIGNILFRDVTRWLIITGVVVSAVLCLLVGFVSFEQGLETDEAGEPRLALFTSEVTSYKVIASPLFGEPEWDLLFDEKLRLNSVAVFAYTLYLFLLSVVLVNLLIAMMADSFERTRSRTLLQFALARAQGILQFLSLPTFFFSRTRPPHHAYVGNAWTMLLQEISEGVASSVRKSHYASSGAAPNPTPEVEELAAAGAESGEAAAAVVAERVSEILGQQLHNQLSESLDGIVSTKLEQLIRRCTRASASGGSSEHAGWCDTALDATRVRAEKSAPMSSPRQSAPPSTRSGRLVSGSMPSDSMPSDHNPAPHRTVAPLERKKVVVTSPRSSVNRCSTSAPAPSAPGVEPSSPAPRASLKGEASSSAPKASSSSEDGGDRLSA